MYIKCNSLSSFSTCLLYLQKDCLFGLPKVLKDLLIDKIPTQQKIVSGPYTVSQKLWFSLECSLSKCHPLTIPMLDNQTDK